MAALDAMHVVVVATRLDNKRQERGRRHCLERLLWELDQLGVEHVWLDARSKHLNAHDLALVDALRARSVLSPRLRIDFCRFYNGADGEILLWNPTSSPAPWPRHEATAPNDSSLHWPTFWWRCGSNFDDDKREAEVLNCIRHPRLHFQPVIGGRLRPPV